MSHWGTCCAGCCNCDPVHDRDLADASAIEHFADENAVLVTQSASQINDGSPINCRTQLTTSKPPCREIIRNTTIDNPSYFAQNNYWRLYPAAVWTPDGGDVSISLCVDTKLTHYADGFGRHLTTYSQVGYVMIGARQGSTYGLCFDLSPSGYGSGFPAGSDGWSKTHHVARTASQVGWMNFDLGVAPWGQPWTIDRSIGAPDVMFGVCLTHELFGSTLWTEVTALIDNVCLKLE